MKTLAGFLLLPLVFLLLWGFAKRSHWTFAKQRLYAVALGLVLLAISGALGLRAARNVREPPQWDFGSMRLYAEVAANGLNFYEPESYRIVTQGRRVPSDLREEVVEVGFQYPPFTMLLFRPWASLSPRAGILLWYALHLAALLADIFLLWQLFTRQEGWLGLGMAGALLLLLFGSYSTVSFTQTLFLLLFFWLMSWRSWGHWPGGVWLALAVIVKPLGAALFVPVLLYRQGRVLVAGAATLTIACIAALAAFGKVTFFSYFTSGVARRIPLTLFAEAENQSLLAVLLRWQAGAEIGKPLTPENIFVALALALAAITCWAIVWLGAQRWELASALMILLALIVYPGSLTSYSVLLAPVILLLWSKREELGANLFPTAFALAGVYAVLGLNYGRFSTWAYLGLWVCLAAAAIRLVAVQKRQIQPAHNSLAGKVETQEVACS